MTFSAMKWLTDSPAIPQGKAFVRLQSTRADDFVGGFRIENQDGIKELIMKTSILHVKWQ
jgi:hypothetical protein